MVQRDVFGRALPSHREPPDVLRSAAVAIEPYAATMHPVDIAEARGGDMLRLWGIFGGRRLPFHVGIVTEPGRMLHASQRAGAVIVSYRPPAPYAADVIGAYRLD